MKLSINYVHLILLLYRLWGFCRCGRILSGVVVVADTVEKVIRENPVMPQLLLMNTVLSSDEGHYKRHCQPT